jgi:protein TIF31
MEERIIRDRTLFKIHCDFVDAATKGAKSVIEKCLLPINPTDPEASQVYIQNNIFYSYAVDSADEKKFGTKNAYLTSNNDLKGVKVFNEVDVRGVHTLATCIVNYRGYRVICQSIIPGILQGEQGSKHIYGSIDEGKTFSMDEKYHKIIEEVSNKLNLKEHVVYDANEGEQKVYVPIETKGILGSDGRFYLLDLVRIQPRDMNYEENQAYLLRSELLRSFYSESEENAKKKINLNLNTNFKIKKENEDSVVLKEMSDYLLNVVIKNLVDDLVYFKISCPFDGK